MKRLMLSIGNRLLPGLHDLVLNMGILASEHGQWRTIRTRSAIDAKGRPVPWYTYPAIEYLHSFDFTCCDVFEFGSGNSSLYWADRARSVVSVEHNEEWFQHVAESKLSNQILLHRPDKNSYSSAIAEQGKSFDVIAIDGEWRLECTRAAAPFLKDRGVIVLDNSDRKIELACGKWLRDQGLLQVDFSGFGPINGYCWTTSLFFRNGTDLQRNFSGPAPVGRLQD